MAGRELEPNPNDTLREAEKIRKDLFRKARENERDLLKPIEGDIITLSKFTKPKKRLVKS